MKCPFCGSAETQVIDSRVSEPGDSIRRRRRCFTCQKRFTTYETVELRLPLDAAINRIVQQVLSLGEREVPSRQIGEMVMQELHKLDKVAYIRFASVYRSFQDVSDFRDALREVETPPPVAKRPRR